MERQGLPWKFSIAELMPGSITEFYLLESSVPHWACWDELCDPTEPLSPLLVAGEQEVCQQLHVTIISCFSAWFSGAGRGREERRDKGCEQCMSVYVGRHVQAQSLCVCTPSTRVGQLWLGISCHVGLTCLHTKEDCC